MTTVIVKPVRRLSARDGLVITLTPEGIYCRKKGRRTTFGPLTYDVLEFRCAQVNAAATRATRASRRGRRRSA